MTYKFDQADSTNIGHPFRFYTDKNKNTGYSTGVTTNGTAGSSGAYSQIKVAYDAPNEIFYQCTAHGLMGHKFKIVSKTVLSDISANDASFNNIEILTDIIGKDASFNDIKVNSIEAFTLKGSIIPDKDDTYDIGSSSKTIRDLYLDLIRYM